MITTTTCLQIWFQNRRAKLRKCENTRKGPGRPTQAVLMQENRSCSGVPIPPDEVIKRQIELQLKRQRSVDAAVDLSRKIHCRLTATPELEMNCRSSTTDGDEEDSQQCITENHVEQQEVVPEGRDVVDRLCGSQQSSENMEGWSTLSVPPSSVEAELNRVDVAGHSQSLRRYRRTCDDDTAPRKRFTLFTIERILHE